MFAEKSLIIPFFQFNISHNHCYSLTSSHLCLFPFLRFKKSHITFFFSFLTFPIFLTPECTQFVLKSPILEIVGRPIRTDTIFAYFAKTTLIFTVLHSCNLTFIYMHIYLIEVFHVTGHKPKGG